MADTVIEIYGCDAWKVESSFLGGEMGDWIAKRRRIEADFGFLLGQPMRLPTVGSLLNQKDG